MNLKTLVASSILIAGVFASSCHPNHPCCRGCDVKYTDEEGEWGVENNDWCFINDSVCHPQNNKCKSGYPCCSHCNVTYTDEDGEWGIENNDWCFINDSLCNKCSFEALGYPCCSHCNVSYTDSNGNWGIENNDWCGIRENCRKTTTKTPPVRTTTRTTTTTTRTTATTTTKRTYPTVSPSFFSSGNIYSNGQYQSEVQSSINRLSGNLQQQAQRVKYTPTAVWLAWDGAPGEVSGHLNAAGGSTAVFMMYWIPTRDCNSNASQGGASDLNAYKYYVDNVYNTFRSYGNSKIVVVVEPDTLGNMVTSQGNENCRRTAVIHKQALAYAINKFGSLNNVQVYLDAGHSQWLSGYEDETAEVIKEILDMAPQGKIRGFSTNVSNFQPVSREYEYHTRLYDALEKVGIKNMRFIVDTSRNGQDISEAFAKTKTWCNFVGTGFGERPKGNPDPVNMPLLDAYMWLKPPAESDGSSTGSRADPVCARSDSLPNAPDAGQWFHDYFVQLLKNANPQF